MTKYPVEMLRDDLAARFPAAAVEVDAPADPAGRWHLDIRPPDGPWIVVEWTSDLG
jgi:hypothetical protein